MTRLVLAGYFGCGNLGDDAMLLGFLAGLGDREVGLTLLSGAPERTYREYNLHSVDRFDFGAIAAELERSQALVFPGGSIFQDVTSLRSVLYYARLVTMAKKAGCRVVLLGQGVGPLNRFFGRRWARNAFNAADLIVVRDPESAATLKTLGVRIRPVLGADLAFLLPEPPAPAEREGFQVGDMRAVGIAPRPWSKIKGLPELFGEVCRLLFQNNFMPVLIEMDENLDGPLIHRIAKTQGGKIPTLERLRSPIRLQQRLARLEGVIAMRLHAGVLAVTVDVVPTMVSYDPKIGAFTQGMGLPAPLALEGLQASRIVGAFLETHRRREALRAEIGRRREEMVRVARENVEMLWQLVSG